MSFLNSRKEEKGDLHAIGRCFLDQKKKDGETFLMTVAWYQFSTRFLPCQELFLFAPTNVSHYQG
jgi:hypothetical protein